MALESILYFATELVFYFKITKNVHFMSNLLFVSFTPVILKGGHIHFEKS